MNQPDADHAQALVPLQNNGPEPQAARAAMIARLEDVGHATARELLKSGAARLLAVSPTDWPRKPGLPVM
ncbi:hypothetical protein [Streptomyces sp. G1]|uniref:hypothetical protein n=1 Tax=Streptomyces sp. G1 TaxID=361572 RepID=UPI002030A3BD|nr:hypothetical protein [Streptomyces sp. G1]MCM1974560.1 hypothetical protein [Streptomyces sp. G1]